MHRHDPALLSGGQADVLVLLGECPTSYQTALVTLSRIVTEIFEKAYASGELKALTIFIEQDPYSFGIALGLMNTFGPARIIVKYGGSQQVDLWTFVE